jgi:hypothetical protein
MAVRKIDDQEGQAPAPTIAGSNGFFAQVVLIGAVLLVGFLGNSYLTTLHQNEQINTEYRGYKDGVRDVR